jgi:hypothetical protein
MYEEASIQKLSQPQIKKLLKGQPVRVKHGNGMSVQMSKAQHKKLMSAHKKGKGTILQLDPYLQQKGQGVITDVIKEIAVELAPHAIDALANVAKKRVGKGVVSEVVKEIGEELLPVAIDAVAKSAKKRVNKGKGVVSDVVKEIGKELAPIAIDAVAKQAKKKVGKGIKEEVVQVVKEIGKELAPHAIDAVAKVAKKRVGKGQKHQGVIFDVDRGRFFRLKQTITDILNDIPKGDDILERTGTDPERILHALIAIRNAGLLQNGSKEEITDCILTSGAGMKKRKGKGSFFGNIGKAIKTSFNNQGSPQERKATSVILNKIEPALIKPLQLLAPPVGQVAEAQRDILKTHYGLGYDRSNGGFNKNNFATAFSKDTIVENFKNIGRGKRPKLVKGSPEAKAYMASIRAKKKGGALVVAGESGGALMTAGMGMGGALAPSGYSYYQ